MVREWLASVLKFVKSALFRAPKPLPVFNPYDAKDEADLLQLINQERYRNGMLPLDDVHELSVIAKESAKINYQYNECNNKPNGLMLEVRLLQKEYASDLSAEIVNRGAKTVEECFYGWAMKPESMGVIRNGYFCHIGIGKCGNFWTAVFAKPKLF